MTGFDFDISAQPTLPAMNGLFVTGTDTDVGKTLIAGAIAQTLRLDGHSVEVFKPAASGCRTSRGDLVSDDAQFLAACSDSAQSLSDITPLRFATPAAPNAAAMREGRTIELDHIFDTFARLEGNCDFVIVEGVGGLTCPISDDFWVIHLAVMMKLPVVIVARADLGTINHTLLTIHAARSAGLHVAGVVINRYPPDILPGASSPATCSQDEFAIITNPAQIAQRGGVEILAIIPEEDANSVEEVSIAPCTQQIIAGVPWAKLARKNP